MVMSGGDSSQSVLNSWSLTLDVVPEPITRVDDFWRNAGGGGSRQVVLAATKTSSLTGC